MNRLPTQPKAARPWYTITAGPRAAEAEVLIYDIIVDPVTSELFGLGISAKSFAAELKALGDIKGITLRINSPGGNVFEGQAIYSILATHKARKTVYIDGIAASIASVIAMVGDEVIMPENAMMMIHDPSSGAWGTADDMRGLADALDKIKTSILNVYMRKTGRAADELGRLMSEETWMTAADAQALGFADRVAEPVAATATFDLSALQFKHPPAALVAAASQRPATPPPIATDNKEGSPMTPEEEKAKKDAEIKAATDAERARVSGIMAGMQPGQEELARTLVDAGVTVDEANTRFLADLKGRKAGHLAVLETEAPASAGGGAEPLTPSSFTGLEGEPLYEKEWETNRNSIQSEFLNKGDYLAFTRASHAGRVKIYTPADSRKN